MKITKDLYYRMGGTSNSNLYRKQDKRGRWHYYQISRRTQPNL